MWLKILNLLTKLPPLILMGEKIYASSSKAYKEWKKRRNKVKLDQAFEKSKQEKTTKDLQEEIGELVE